MKKNIILIILLVIIDQIIKLVCINTIGSLGGSITLIPKVLSLTITENIGAAWGLFSSRILLIGVDIMIIYAVIRLLHSKKYEIDKNAKLGLSLIVAGGIGNLIDRIFRGYVVDYIDITQLIDYPIFNFADICIVIGVILVCVLILINSVKNQEKVNEKV